MNNILLQHIDVIFGIARQNDKDIGVGVDMFRANLAAGQERYQGAPGRRVPDYAALSNTWNAMSDGERSAVTNTYNDLVRDNYKALTELSQAEQYAEMVALATAED